MRGRLGAPAIRLIGLEQPDECAHDALVLQQLPRQIPGVQVAPTPCMCNCHPMSLYTAASLAALQMMGCMHAICACQPECCGWLDLWSNFSTHLAC